jgi:hypothetical protein
MKCISLRTLVTIIVGPVLLCSVLANSVAAPSPEDAPYLRQVRAIETAELGIPSATGLAFSSQDNAFLALGAQGAGQPSAADSQVTKIALFEEELTGSLSTPGRAPDPLNMTFDDETNSLVFLDRNTGELVELPAAGGPGIPRLTASQLGLKAPQGLTVDAAGGRLFLLDAAGPHIVALPPAGGALKIPLDSLRGPKLRGLAFNPTNGHLYVLSPAKHALYELTETGQLVATYDLTATELTDPQGMVFAPSGDPTDDAAIMGLYIADSGRGAGRGRGHVGGQIIELSLTEPVLALVPSKRRGAAPLSEWQSSQAMLTVQSAAVSAAGSPPSVEAAALVHTIDTSRWSPASPDPGGITYLPASGTILVADAEVDEMPPYFAGKNIFESTTGGSLFRTFSTTAFSKEPTDVAVNPTNKHLFFSDDDKDRIFEVDPGGDRQFGTGDDTVTSFDTRAFDSFDPEGVTFGPGLGSCPGQGHLFIADGVGREVYEIAPGPNCTFDGVTPPGDDTVTHFDTSTIDLQDPSGIDFNQATGTLVILDPHSPAHITETTTAGEVVHLVDISSANPVRPDGVTLAPGSLNSAKMNFYIADRGIDNDADPNENDGKVYELTLLPPPVNLLTNSGFELDANSDNRPDNWTSDSRFTRSQEVQALEGSYTGKHFATNDVDYSIGQTVNNLTAGTTYRFSGWVNIPPTGDTFVFKFQVRWRNASNNNIGVDTIKAFRAATDGWVAAAGSLVAPAGTTKAEVLMTFVSPNATVYVDHLVFGP